MSGKSDGMNQAHLIVRNGFKRRIVSAFLTGIITSGMVSFTVVLINLGLTKTFLQVWIKSWFTALLIAFPVVLLVASPIRRFVDTLFKDESIPRESEN
jgi:uncharacterized membrane protein